MHYFIGGIATQSESTFSGLMARAQGIYRDNLASYMRLVLRKPLSRLMVRHPCLASLSSLDHSNADIAPLCRTSSRRSSAPCTRAQRRLRKSQTNRRRPRPRSRRSSGSTTPRTFARRESPLPGPSFVFPHCQKSFGLLKLGLPVAKLASRPSTSALTST